MRANYRAVYSLFVNTNLFLKKKYEPYRRRRMEKLKNNMYQNKDATISREIIEKILSEHNYEGITLEIDQINKICLAFEKEGKYPTDIVVGKKEWADIKSICYQ